MNQGVSIIICTYNGLGRLRETIKHIALQQVREDISWELILIDNNSTDGSADFAQKEWDRYGNAAPLFIKSQPKQGLTMAREMGIQAANYEYVILCDDDNWLSPNYVTTAYDIMSSHPSIGISGGCGELIYEEAPPPWLLQLKLLAGGPQAPGPGKVQSYRVYGAGCVLRKSAYLLLKESGFTFMLSDRRGAQLSSGGDHELCYILALLDYDIWYDGNLRFKHYITKERLSLNYWIKYVKESSACSPVLEPYRMLLNGVKPTQFSFAKHLWKIFIYFFLRFLPVFFKRWIWGKNSENGKCIYLRYVLLKEQLQNCIFHSSMKRNFLKISELNKNKDPYFRPDLKLTA